MTALASAPAALDSARSTLFASAGLVVHDDPSGDGRRVAEVPARGLFRLSADLGRLVDAVAAADGLTPEEIAGRLGAPWTPEFVVQGATPLLGMGVLTPERPAAADLEPARTPRLLFRPPLVVQWTVLDPERVFAWARRRPAIFTGTLVPALLIALGVLGLPLLAFFMGRTGGPLHEPFSAAQIYTVLGALLVTIGIHEFAHGATLAAYGGRSKRMGLMLFYLAPAMFCDVTDAWRLPREARVRVAMAGLVVQSAIAGVAILAATVTSGSLQAWLVIYALVSYSMAIVNLLPFVKLDGYVALAGGMDHPHLRRDTIAALRARLLGGARPDVPSWGPWFGLAAVITPIFLIMSALSAGTQFLVMEWGFVGAIGSAIVLFAFSCWALRAAAKGIAGALAAGTSPRRLAGVLAALAAVLLVLGAGVKLPLRVDAGLNHGVLAVPRGQPLDRIAGRTGEVGRPGLLFQSLPGVSVRVGAPTGDCDAPITGLTPVSADQTLRTHCMSARVSGSLDGSPHHVLVPAGSVPAASWLWERYVAPTLRELG